MSSTLTSIISKGSWIRGYSLIFSEFKERKGVNTIENLVIKGQYIKFDNFLIYE